MIKLTAWNVGKTCKMYFKVETYYDLYIQLCIAGLARVGSLDNTMIYSGYLKPYEEYDDTDHYIVAYQHALKCMVDDDKYQGLIYSELSYNSKGIDIDIESIIIEEESAC